MKLSDFDFDLPEGLIATRPAKPRSSARLLVATPTRIVDRHVTDLLDWFRPGDRLVLNDTRVLPARLTGKRGRDTAQGYQEAKIELTLLEPQSVPGQWKALIKPLKKIREGEEVKFSDDLSATLVAKEEGEALVAFNLTGEDFDRALNAAGSMPLPPYIEAKRKADQQDKADYQTVWAKNLGAVAAPTASLHFDEPLLKALSEKGVEFTYVTLHVGAGTFLPVKVDDVSQHKMHSEWGEVSEGAAIEINTTKQRGGRVIPVGTTALRLIESAAPAPGVIAPFLGETDIFIKPGYEFRIADALMTNFHLPKSTLMMLVSAMMGRERMMQVYDHAVAERYRFFSYGDASLLLPQEP
ncbi:tRNA preQ1(34) S-adenosylmethionine ribosyltransferase-isomerase QueA [Celeribacter persicus]|uniref:S-adenosylmethionine:tRNA ribosyltransferase-isomerase n=1 Tax=Celeribacter persicus TaxID=1651082 RepID=A0A2T5HSK7_9RHOB|nr:tRNA preQ1(34) S-adenosylmethionine ribosyltransferase-isomerase QueA [Celeribacter persicus]PTQ74573.1 S-adenosylmethionine:tRNA ribosyltransferase-isomerase [Celeribacter persicus]